MYKVERNHETVLNGKKICYKTICQDNPVRDAEGNTVGTVFPMNIYVRM